MEQRFSYLTLLFLNVNGYRQLALSFPVAGKVLDFVMITGSRLLRMLDIILNGISNILYLRPLLI